jgi:hypothetical protein
MMLKVAKLGIAIAAVLAWIVPAAYAGVPDVANSFFVPQRGSVGTPSEGNTALLSFRVCPNNDAGTALAANARIKVVVRDVNGNGIPGIAAADICMLFNGGTAAQGFSGVGSDSVIANRQWNTLANCPDVRCVQADGATDALGTTYITLIGASALNPGVGVRDALRKWGHYDFEIPVFVLGFKLQGRLTTASLNGTYSLRVKNFDISQPAGLGAINNQGETVSLTDVNQFAPNAPGNPAPDTAQAYWCDFNSDGAVALSDVNEMTGHVGHDCDSPIP